MEETKCGRLSKCNRDFLGSSVSCPCLAAGESPKEAGGRKQTGESVGTWTLGHKDSKSTVHLMMSLSSCSLSLFLTHQYSITGEYYSPVLLNTCCGFFDPHLLWVTGRGLIITEANSQLFTVGHSQENCSVDTLFTEELLRSLRGGTKGR